ncbi:MAG: hypothetical protein PHW90_00670 [Bacilli bacterium]|nr:hypothetical protein [Bacilli bacterium]
MQKNNRNGEKEMLEKLRIKLFGRSRKQLTKDIRFLCLEVSDILEDMSEDLDDLHSSVNESLRLTLIVQKQCNEIIEKMEKNRTLDEIVDNIEKLVGKGNADEQKDI